MSVAERVEVVLEFNDGGFQMQARGAERVLRRFGRSIQQADRRVERMERNMRGFTATLRDWTLIIGQARNAMHQIMFLTTDWAKGIINVNAEIERMTKLLEGMSKGATQMEKAANATNTLNNLFDRAKSAPFTINALTDSFVKFKSVGLDPTDGSMNSLIDAVAAFGGTDDILKRASIAIQQMGGKGVISMEELRQQLGEAVPEAITLMAQSMGVSYGQLVKEISKGTVAAEPALKSMFNAFGMVYGGRAQRMMDTFRGKQARISTEWKQLLSSNEGQVNFFNSMKNALDEVIRVLDTDAMTQFFTNLGNAATWVVENTIEASRQIGQLYNSAFGLWELLSRSWSEGDGFLGAVHNELKLLIPAMQKAVDLLGGDSSGIDQDAGFLGNLVAISDQIWALRDQGLNKALEWAGKDLKRSMGVFMGDAEATEKDLLEVLTGKKGGVLESTMKLGRDIQADQLNQAREIRQQHLRDMESDKDRAKQLRVELNAALAGDVGRVASQGQRILTPGQMAAGDGAIAQIDTRIEQREQEISDIRAQIDAAQRQIAQIMGGPDAMTIVEEETVEQSRTAISNLRTNLNELISVKNQLVDEQRDIRRAMLQTQMKSQAIPGLEREQNNIAGQLSSMRAGMGVAFNPEDPAVQAMKARLLEIKGILEGIRGIDVSRQIDLASDETRALNRALQETEDQIKQNEDELRNMTESLADGLGKSAEELAQPFKDQFAEVQAEAGDMFRKFLEEQQKINTDLTLSAEDRESQIAKIREEYFAKTSALYVELGEAAQEKLAEQGAAGMRAVAMVYAMIQSALSKLKNQEDQAGDLGIPTLDDDKGGSSGVSTGGGGKSDAQKALERMSDMSDELKRKTKDLTEEFIDPFGFQIPNEIKKTQEKLEKIAKTLGAGSIEASKFSGQMQALMQQARQAALLEASIEMKETNRSMALDQMGSIKAARVEADERIKGLKEMRAYYKQHNMWRLEQERLLQEQIRLIQQEFVQKTPLGEFANKWKDFATDMQSVAVDAFDGISQSLADLVTEGKANFADLSRSILNSMMKVSINAGISALVSRFAPALAGGLPAGVKHSGGIVGGSGISRNVSSGLFANAPRFHTGGIVGDEVPIIAKRKEGVFTEEQMKAIGKGMSRPSGPAKINIINETGTQVDQVESNERFDGEGMILDVVLGAAGRPGKFRDSMKEVLK